MNEEESGFPIILYVKLKQDKGIIDKDVPFEAGEELFHPAEVGWTLKNAIYRLCSLCDVKRVEPE